MKNIIYVPNLRSVAMGKLWGKTKQTMSLRRKGTGKTCVLQPGRPANQTMDLSQDSHAKSVTVHTSQPFCAYR